MKKLLGFKHLLVLGIFVGFGFSVNAQFLVEMADTTSMSEKGLFSAHKNNDYLKISGYFQPQFQIAESKGIKSYSGGDFEENVSNRFMLRRARIRFDYVHFTDEGQPQAQVVFQFDGTERGVFIRDFWGRFYENKWQLLSITAGMFARPFGYELNYSSSDRETPERGRMSQILMKTERDLGAMVSFETRKKNHPLKYFKLDAGIFNGQGLTSPNDYDSYKDFISRLALKPYPLNKNTTLSAGISYLNGGFIQNSVYVNRVHEKGGLNMFVLDSSLTNKGAKAPRKYYGADAQIKFKHGWGETELRAEYWWGTQTATATASETPPELLVNEPYYIRKFNGGFFYLLQNIVNEKHQIVAKFDWYDPNREVEKLEIGDGSRRTTEADIKFSTVGIGYNHYFNDNIKLMLYYDLIYNETTTLPDYTSDVDDNVFTARLQYEF
jgi:hypothetical protein